MKGRLPGLCEVTTVSYETVLRWSTTWGGTYPSAALVDASAIADDMDAGGMAE